MQYILNYAKNMILIINFLFSLLFSNNNFILRKEEIENLANKLNISSDKVKEDYKQFEV